MPDTPHSDTPLRSGLSLGPNRILRWLGASDLGAAYEATFGSTTHAYRLLVLSPNLGLDAERLDAVLKPLGAVSHPCLAKPFAWGADERELWIRSELTPGVSLGSFDLPADDKANPLRRGEMVAHAGRLHELFRGAIPQSVLWPLVADLLEGLACLHRAGLAVGPFTPESVIFQKGRHGHGVVAKWTGYGLLPLLDPEAAAQTTPRDDVRSAGQLIRRLLGGEGRALPPSVWPEWATLLAGCEAGADGFADGTALYDAFLEMLDAHGAKREPRHDAAVVPPEKPAKPRAGSAKPRTHERRRRVGTRRHHPDTPSDAMASTVQAGPAFRVFAMLVVLCAIGYGAYWAISRGDRLRKEGLVGPSVRAEAVDPGSPVVETVADHWALDRDGLEEHAKTGEPAGTMRLAFLVAAGDDAHPADERRGAELARGALALLEKRVDEAQADGDTLYWIAHARLTGLGTERDEAKGRAALDRAIRQHNHRRSMALLADYLAFGQGEGREDDDRTALSLWQKAVEGRQALGQFEVECVDKAVAFLLAGRGLPRGEAAPVVKWLEGTARLRHVGAMLCMGTLLLEGRLVPLNEPQARNWFREAAIAGSAEGMRRMAWMFERGIGTPRSDKSAAVWYRRAALGGDPDAMESLAQMMSEGRGDETSNPAEEAEWRRKAAAARAAAATRSSRRSVWWRPGSDVSASPDPAASAAVATPTNAVPPEATAPAGLSDRVVPPVAPEILRPGDGKLMPMD